MNHPDLILGELIEIVEALIHASSDIEAEKANYLLDRLDDLKESLYER